MPGDGESDTKKITLFAVPKAFEGHIGAIQSNAILSWLQWTDCLDVVLFGDDDGVAEFAKENSIRHFPEISRNQAGTPLLDTVFQRVIENSRTQWMLYINSDIVLNSSVYQLVKSLENLNLTHFLGIGQRTDFDQTDPIAFEDPNWESDLANRIARSGQLASILCKDYFLFPRGHFHQIPAFSIGRGNWDSWMVATTIKSNAPVIDCTEVLFAGHQNHDYRHAGNRLSAYVTGNEAQQNKHLAGGSHYMTGSVATHRLRQSGILQKKTRIPFLTFIRDVPRLTKLVYKLLIR